MTKFKTTKQALFNKVLQCAADYTTKTPYTTYDQFEDLIMEMMFLKNTLNAISNAKRTRELDSITRGFFGFDTAEEAIEEIEKSEEDEEREELENIHSWYVEEVMRRIKDLKKELAE